MMSAGGAHAAQLAAAVECKNGVDAAQNDLWRRECGEQLRFELPQALVVARNPKARTFGKDRHLVAPITTEAVEPADEEHRKSSTVPFIVKVAVADRNARHRPEVRLRGCLGG